MNIKNINEEITNLLNESYEDNIVKNIINEILQDNIKAAEQILIDNGIEEDEVSTVLQAIGYALLDKELYPEE